MPQALLNTQFTLQSITKVAEQLLQLNQKTVLFDAPMGAGKTTLIKEMCKQLGSSDNFSSPTYQLVNEYKYANGKIFHLDLFRLKTVEELLDIGFEDYIKPTNFCFIEWPNLAEEFLEFGFIKATITVNENARFLSVIKF